MKTQTMSDLTIWLDGKQAEHVDAIAKSYQVLDSQIKQEKAELETLKAELKDLNNGSLDTNTYETSNFLIMLVGRKGSKTIDQSVFQKLYPEVFNDDRIWKIGEPSLALKDVKAKV